MAGTFWSNSTSITGPITCTTRPTLSVAMSIVPCHPRRRGSAAPHEFYVLRSPCYVLRATCYALLDDVLELVVHEVDLVHLARGEGLDEVAGDGLGRRVAQGLEQPHLLGADPVLPPPEEIAALAAEQVELDRLRPLVLEEAHR